MVHVPGEALPKLSGFETRNQPVQVCRDSPSVREHLQHFVAAGGPVGQDLSAPRGYDRVKRALHKASAINDERRHSLGNIRKNMVGLEGADESEP